MTALILIDVQNDFMPGGPLAVPKADEIIPIINQLMPKFEHVLATQDWHPHDHVSFAATHQRQAGEVIEIEGVEQILWPVHCVQNTPGADFAKGLKKEKIEASFHKGVDPKIDSYSAFFDNAQGRATGLADHLKKGKLKELYFVGVATDYCVLYSVLDALDLGFTVTVFRDACRAINRNPGDEGQALEQMRQKGAKVTASSEA